MEDNKLNGYTDTIIINPKQTNEELDEEIKKLQEESDKMQDWPFM